MIALKSFPLLMYYNLYQTKTVSRLYFQQYTVCRPYIQRSACLACNTQRFFMWFRLKKIRLACSFLTVPYIEILEQWFLHCIVLQLWNLAKLHISIVECWKKKHTYIHKNLHVPLHVIIYGKSALWQKNQQLWDRLTWQPATRLQKFHVMLLLLT